MSSTREHDESLWWLAVPPAIWTAHFLAVYITISLACVEPNHELTWVRWAIGGYTVIAAAGVVATGVRGLGRHNLDGSTAPHDFDTPEDRHQFLGLATLLLSGLALVGILFVALPALYFGTCR